MPTPFEDFFTLPFLVENERNRPVVIRWIPDAKLQHHINCLLKQEPQLTEATLAQILLNNLKQNVDSLQQTELSQPEKTQDGSIPLWQIAHRLEVWGYKN